MKLTVTEDTTFFREIRGIEHVKPVHKGYQCFIKAYQVEGELLKFSLDISKYPIGWLASFHPGNINTWYVDKNKVEDPSGYSKTNNPKDEPPVKNTTGKGVPLKFPGFTGTYYSGDAITMLNGKPVNFTWGEAFHVVSSNNWRKPANTSVVNNVIHMSRELQKIRKLFGDRPILINSWYRDPVTNRRVGGATQSRHLTGGAIDFQVQGLSTKEVFNKLDPIWGDNGGLAYHPAFVHIDNRGYKARWDY